jgi:hypothetical protein
MPLLLVTVPVSVAAVWVMLVAFEAVTVGGFVTTTALVVKLYVEEVAVPALFVANA